MNRYTKPQEPASEIDELMGKLYDHINVIEELQEDLAEAIECYRDDSDDEISEMQIYLDDAIREKEINEMLYMELNAGRKELQRLIGCLKEQGIILSDGQYINYGRLDTDCYEQDPDSPFYLENPDDRYRELLQDQYFLLREFEEHTPMTTSEKNALRTHVIRENDFNEGNQNEWDAFLKGFRARSKQ